VKVRVQKLLSQNGFGSRREIESWIKQGRLYVNSSKAELGQLVSEKDKFRLDQKHLKVRRDVNYDLRILIYNKKIGEISTRKDPSKRPTIFDSLPDLNLGRWISIGRLDINTSGLILFTNNGELANKLMHPSSNIEREYVARINGEVTEIAIKRMLDGVVLDDGKARFTDIQEGRKGKTNQWFAMVIMEGKNREVRRIWESQGFKVSRLKRVRYGSIFLPASLKQGDFKELSRQEVKSISNL
tara:strand:+ start:84498 stop:85223 length:726 start_codon:yes stop_codon:yes gene_type:complete